MHVHSIVFGNWGEISNSVYVVLLRVTKQISLFGIKGEKVVKGNRKLKPHGNEQ